MKIKYYGHSCFSLTFADGTVLVTDPFDSHITYRPCDAECTAALLSHHHGDHCFTDCLRGDFTVIESEGAHNVGNVHVSAMHSWHDHHQGKHRGNNLLMKICGDGLTIAHLGDLGHIPDARQQSFLSKLDILMIPVGGHYTINSEEAVQVMNQLRPRITIAMHYRTPANSNFDSDTYEPFAKAAHAVSMPRIIDITPENIDSIPAKIIMAYE